MRVWIDTDVGTNPDDAIALLLACAHPRVELAGVSTTGGDEDRRAGVARGLLDAAGARHVAVVPGPAFVSPVLADVDALLAIGPLTNVARLASTDLQLPALTVMGGAMRPVDHRGATRDVESNFAADPQAAAVVLRAAQVHLVPLDVTARMRLDDAARTRLVEVAPAARDELARWHDALCLHDPLALLALLGEPVVRSHEQRVAVRDDGRVVESDGGPVHTVVHDVDVGSAMTRILDVLDGAGR